MKISKKKNTWLFNRPVVIGKNTEKKNSVTIAAFFVLVLIISGCGDRDDIQVDNGFRVQHTSDGELTHQVGMALESSADYSHEFNGNGYNIYMEWCEYSGKQVRSRRYGAVLVHESGSVQRFRSTESMIRYLVDEDKTIDDYEKAGVVEFISADKLYAPEELVYHISRNLPSPDGGNISALNPHADESLLYNIGEAYPGTRLSWGEVWEKVAQSDE